MTPSVSTNGQQETAAQTRRVEIERDLPCFFDLLRRCTEAGMSLHEAICTVCQQLDGPLADELREAFGPNANITDMADALTQMAMRVDVPDLTAAVERLVCKGCG